MVIWVSLFTGDCRRVVATGSTYGCGGFIRHCCFVLSGTDRFRKRFSGFSDRMSFLCHVLFINGDGFVRTGIATVVGTAGWKWRAVKSKCWFY